MLMRLKLAFRKFLRGFGSVARFLWICGRFKRYRKVNITKQINLKIIQPFGHWILLLSVLNYKNPKIKLGL